MARFILLLFVDFVLQVAHCLLFIFSLHYALQGAYCYCPYDVNIMLCKVHIDIRFERRMHGDGDPFDGLGGTLAHAYFPVVAIPFHTYYI